MLQYAILPFADQVMAPRVSPETGAKLLSTTAKSVVVNVLAFIASVKVKVKVITPFAMFAVSGELVMVSPMVLAMRVEFLFVVVCI